MMIKVESIILDKDNVLRLTVMTPNKDTYDIVTKRENLRSPNNLDIGWIPSSVPEYQQAAEHLTLTEEE